MCSSFSMSATSTFLRTAARTFRHSLDAGDFLGCWGENEFLAVLPSARPVTVATTADRLRHLLSHSEVLWCGDHFRVESEVAHTVVTAGDDLGIGFARDEAVARERHSMVLLLIHRPVSLLHASFRPHLAVAPLRFTNLSSPSDRVEDSHLRAVEHAWHTIKKAGQGGQPEDCISRCERCPISLHRGNSGYAKGHIAAPVPREL